MIVNLNTRLVVDNSKSSADDGLTIPILDLPNTADHIWFEVNNSKQFADDLKSISLNQIKQILNNETITGFNLHTRIKTNTSLILANAGVTTAFLEIENLIAISVSFESREDGGLELREDNGKEERN